MSEDSLDFESLAKDLDALARRAATAKYLEAKQEFHSNAYPWMAAFLASVNERFEEIEEAVYEGVGIPEELVAAINMTFDLGLHICEAIEQSNAQELSDSIKAYRASVEAVRTQLTEEDEEDTDPAKPALASVPAEGE